MVFMTYLCSKFIATVNATNCIMKISVEQIVSMIEEDPYPPELNRNFACLFDPLYPLLYMAARNDGITVIDVIIALRRCTLMTWMLTAKVLEPAYIESVKLAIEILAEEDNRTNEMRRGVHLLQHWVDTCSNADVK